jgi:uncharacterized protein (TIGR03437 family)
VVLTQAAPTGGIVVNLAIDNQLLSVPGFVSVAAGATSVSVAVTAGNIPSAQTAILTATLNNGSKTAGFTLTPSTAKPSRRSPPGVREVEPGTPTIREGGVVNAASFLSAVAPLGSLAQGSLFSIYGSDLGPDRYVKANGSASPGALGGVSVQILHGSEEYDAGLVLASKGQINAVLPAGVPLGDAQVVVTFNGKTSAAAEITVSRVSIGVFQQEVNGQSVAVARSLRDTGGNVMNLPESPASSGEVVDLWVTGAGAVPDATAVAITVGGIPAQREYPDGQIDATAVGHIFFRIPSGIAYGCQVPVAITAGGISANPTVIAVSADGSPCR